MKNKILELLDKVITRTYTDGKKKEQSYTTSIKDLIKEGMKNIQVEDLVFDTVEIYGGGEGDGEEYWIVFLVQEVGANNKYYYKVPGWYQSYHGGELEWENIYPVEPVQKVITVWE